MKKKLMIFYIDKELRKEMEKYCNETGADYSKTIRLALRKLFDSRKKR